MFSAQAIARDVIANGREKEVLDITKEIPTITPELPPEPSLGFASRNPKSSRTLATNT